MKRIILILSALILSSCGLAEHMGRSCGGDLKELCYNVVGGRSSSADGDAIGVLIDKTNALEAQLRADRDQIVFLDQALSNQGAGLQSQVNSILTEVAGLQASDVNLNSQLNTLRQDILTANNSLAVVSGQVIGLQGDTTMLQLNTNALALSLSSLSGYVASLVSQGTAAYNTIQSQIQALQGQAVSTGSSLTALTSLSTSLQTSVNSTLVQLAVLQGYTHIVAIHDPCGQQGTGQNEVFLKLSDGHFLASFSDTAAGMNTRFSVLKDGSFVTTDGTNCSFTVSNGGTVISQ